MPVWLSIILILAALAAGALIGIMYRKNVGEREIGSAEEEAKKAQEAAAAQAAGQEAAANNEAAPATGTDQAAALTPEQTKELEAVQKQYKEDLDTVGFYGTDHVGFICEWD